MTLNIEKVRSDFPELSRQVHEKPLIYFDNAASTLKVQSVIDSIDNHYKNDASNIHRGVHFLSEHGTQLYEQTRDTIQKFINAKERYEIIFTKGTTDSINLVANSFCEKYLQSGDEIILTTMEHHSNIVPWQIAAQKKGAKIVECPVTDEGEIDLEAFKKLLNPKVKMVATCHVSNTLGTINPVKEIIKLSHENGSKVLIDGAQAIAHLKVDVQDLNCDFYAFSSHKIFGPTGVGVLYGKEEVLNAIPPYQGGGDMIDVVSFEGTTYNDLPHKFEAGTPHIAGVIALKEAFDYLSSIGIEEIAKREDELLEYGTKRIQEIEGVKIIGTAKKKSAVISFVIDGAHPHDLGMLLDRQGIAVRTGHHCTQPLMKRMGVTATARASFCFYNTKEEIDQFIEALKKCKELL